MRRRRRACSPLVKEAETCNEELAVELEELEELHVDVFIDYWSAVGYVEGTMGQGHSLFSVLMRAVSILPFSSKRAISLLEAFACAFFFSWRVRSLWTPNLTGPG